MPRSTHYLEPVVEPNSATYSTKSGTYPSFVATSNETPVTKNAAVEKPLPSRPVFDASMQASMQPRIRDYYVQDLPRQPAIEPQSAKPALLAGGTNVIPATLQRQPQIPTKPLPQPDSTYRIPQPYSQQSVQKVQPPDILLHKNPQNNAIQSPLPQQQIHMQEPPQLKRSS